MKIFKRLMIAVIFIPLLMLLFIKGGYYLSTFIFLTCSAMVIELRKMLIKKGVELSILIIPISVAMFYIVGFGNLWHILGVFLLSNMIILSVDLFKNRLEGAFNRISAANFNLVYIVVGMALSIKVENIELLKNGNIYLLFLLILIWLTDSAAYFFGMLLGRKRNIFKASPKKSVIGFVAGFLISFLGAYIISLIFPSYRLDVLIYAAISAGIFGQFGDLFESIIKRDCGVKDSSNFLPGHGGLLDRFDSFVIAVPTFYLLINIFVN